MEQGNFLNERLSVEIFYKKGRIAEVLAHWHLWNLGDSRMWWVSGEITDTWLLHQNVLADLGSKAYVLSLSEAGTKEISWGKHSCIPKVCVSPVDRNGATDECVREERLGAWSHSTPSWHQITSPCFMVTLAWPKPCMLSYLGVSFGLLHVFAQLKWQEDTLQWKQNCCCSPLIACEMGFSKFKWPLGHENCIPSLSKEVKLITCVLVIIIYFILVLWQRRTGESKWRLQDVGNHWMPWNKLRSVNTRITHW